MTSATGRPLDLQEAAGSIAQDPLDMVDGEQFTAVQANACREETQTPLRSGALSPANKLSWGDPLSREDTVDSQTPLVNRVPQQVPPRLDAAELPSAPTDLISGGPPPRMRGDLPADFLEEVPGEHPTTVPMPPVGMQASSPNLGTEGAVQPSWTSMYPRAEAFLGVLHVPCEPALGPPGNLNYAMWLIGHRRVEKALKFLSRDDTPATSEAAFLRLRCLIALRRYSAASDEAARLSMIAGDRTPLEARVLLAQLPCITSVSEAPQSLALLQDLVHLHYGNPIGKAKFEQDSRPSLEVQLQLWRVLSQVSLLAGHGQIAVNMMISALAAMHKDDSAAIAAVSSLLGRHHVNAGNSLAASEAFKRAHCILPEDSPIVQIDLGLLAVTDGKYFVAREHFCRAATMACNNVESNQFATACAIDEAITAENNLAVCRLYTRELKEGINGLEAFVRRNPVAHLQSSVAQNLSALYEFTTNAAERRAALREIATAFHLEDLDPRSFEQPGAA